MKKLFTMSGVLLLVLGTPLSLFAADGVASGALESYRTLSLSIGAALAIGISVVGGALGQGRAIASAMEGIGRNPGSSEKIFVPMIIGLALIESLVIFSLLIAYMLLEKIA